MPEVKIKKIEIKIGDKTLKMTIEQAMGLQAELNGRFPVLAPTYPVITYPGYPTYPPYYEYTYTAGGIETSRHNRLQYSTS